MAGVNGITGYVIASPEAPPFEQQGGTVDPYHSNTGEMARPYPWEVVPIGPYPGKISPDDALIDDSENWGIAAGILSEDPTADQTPAYNAAPFLRENPVEPMAEQLDTRNRNKGSARQLWASMRIHAANRGAGLRRLFAPTQLAKQDSWNAFFNPVQGEDIVPKIPGSIANNAGGFGVNDHVSNPYAKVNSYGFNTSHRHRRYATGPIPGNTLWLKARSRPMVRSFTGIHQFPVSGAFAGDDPGATFGIDGAILTGTPSQYAPPPQPMLGNPVISTAEVPDISFY